MKTQESLLKEEYNFDLLHKNDNIDNFKYPINYKEKINNPQAEQKKTSLKLVNANRFITGLVNELRQNIEIDGFDDDIFQKKSNKNSSKKNIKNLSIFRKQFSKNSQKNSNLKKNHSINNCNFIQNAKSLNNKNPLYNFIINGNKMNNKKISDQSLNNKNDKNRNRSSSISYVMNFNNKKKSDLNLNNSNNKRNRSESVSYLNILNNKIPESSPSNNNINNNIINNNKNKRSNSISVNKESISQNKGNLKINSNLMKKLSNQGKIILQKNNTMMGLEEKIINNQFNKKTSFKPLQLSNSFKSNQQKDYHRVKTTNIKSSKLVKFDIPEKRKSHRELKKWDEIEKKKKNKNKKNKKDKTNGLFSFFARPEYFEDNNISISKRDSHRDKLSMYSNFEDENERLFKMTRISNKSILELNDITNDLKKSLVLTPKNGKELENLKKSFIAEGVDFIDGLNLSEINESDEEKDKIDLEKYRELQKKGLVYDSLDEYNDQDIGQFFIKPDSNILKILDCFVFIMTFYCLISYPLFLGINYIYCRTGSLWNFSIIFDFFVDFVFIIDFLISNFIGYYNSDDILKTNIFDIILHNLKRWFLPDLICAIPIKTFFTIFDTKCKNIGYLISYKYTNNHSYLLILLRLIKIIKILHKNKFLKYLDESLDKYEFYNNYYDFFKNILISFIVVNLIACIFLFLGKNEYPSWIINYGFEEENFHKLYFLCIYYIITTVTTVGYGDLVCITTKEKVFGIIVEVVGIFAYSWVISSISNYVKSQSDAEEEYLNKYKILEDIKLKYPDLSDDLFDRINRYIKTKQNNEDQEKNLIEELPITLKNVLVYSMYEPIIKNFIFFKNFDNKDFIVRVLFCFKPILGIRNDILIKDGDFIEDIIFVKSGKIGLELPIRITDNSNEETNTNYNTTNLYTTNYLCPHNTSDFEEEPEYIYQNFKILDIRKNEHFGDVLMFSNERSPLSAIVKSRKAELFYLNKKDAIEISQSYPQIWQKITKKSLFNMAQIRRLMSKVSKIFQITKGLILSEKDIDTVSPNHYEDLKSIPTISDMKNTLQGINGLNTIKENEDGSEETFSSRTKKNNTLNNENTIKTEVIKYASKNINNKSISESQSDSSSSCFTENSKLSKKSKKSKLSKKSKKSILSKKSKVSKKTNFSKKSKTSENYINETKRVTHITNLKIDFSDKCLSDDIGGQYYISNRSNYTPYKPEEINNEIYPNENFMKYNNTNNIAHKIINKKCNSNNNNDNVSICSTEISFSINSKYENIDELSDYRYSKIPKLRKKIKSILKDHDYTVLDTDNFSRYSSKIKANKSFKKSYISFDDSYNKKMKSIELRKCPSDDMFKKKKKSKHYKAKKLESISPHKKSHQSDVHLNILHQNSIKNFNEKNEYNNYDNTLNPSFSNFFHRFIENEIKKTKNEIKDYNDELNKQIKKMEIIKKNLSLKNQQG